MSSTNLGSSNSEVALMQEELRQLRRTLEIRKSEIALTSKRVQDLEDLSRAMRGSSMLCDEQTRHLNTLEINLRAEVERGVVLQRELKQVQDAIVEEDEGRADKRKRQLSSMAMLMKVADEMLQISHEAAASEPLPPRSTIKGLQKLGDDLVQSYDAATALLNEKRQAYGESVLGLQALHQECVQTIEDAAVENIKQRNELELEWKREEQELARELHAVRQRAKEAAFHHHRGSGLKFEPLLEERQSIAERRRAHQECLNLETEIRKTENERERAKVANAKGRASLLAK
jgi:hypothetical protein